MNRNHIRTSLIGSLILASSAFTTAMAVPFDTLTVSEETQLAAYEKVYIAPVSVNLTEDTRRNIRDINSERPVTPQDQARRADKFQKYLARDFGKRFEIVEAPADDVLVIEATITQLASTRPTLADANVNVQLDFSRSIYAGSASYSVNLQAGDLVLAEIADSYDTTLNDGRPRIAIWQDADAGLSLFSRQLARYVAKN